MSHPVGERPPREVSLEPMPSAPGEPRKLIVPLKASGRRPPLFVVPGQYGEAFHFKRLAQHLRDDIPFYSFEAQGLWGDIEPHATIEATARDYIAEMREIQPDGPYLIGGFSAGGMTAWEMVQQLEAAGEAAHLLLFDVGPETFDNRARRQANPPGPWLRLTHPIRVLNFHVRNALGLTGPRRRAYIRTTFRQDVRRWTQRLGLGRENFIVRMTLSAGRKPPPGHLAVRKASREAREDWDWRPYSAPFTLLRAELQQPGVKRTETLGFTAEQAPGGIEVRHVPGHHGFIFSEPHVFSVIAEIEDWVDGLRRQHAGTVEASQRERIAFDEPDHVRQVLAR